MTNPAPICPCANLEWTPEMYQLSHHPNCEAQELSTQAADTLAFIEQGRDELEHIADMLKDASMRFLLLRDGFSDSLKAALKLLDSLPYYRQANNGMHIRFDAKRLPD